VSAGDDRAFSALVSRYGGFVHRTCLRLLRDEHEAQDTCQAVFLVLARKAGGLGRGDISAWLYRVARLAAAKAVRNRMRRARREEQYAADEPGDGEASVMNETDRQAVLDAVDSELAALPARHREAVLLRYLRGYSQEDAAQRIGCPVGTLSYRASCGIAKLRKRLASRGIALGVPVLAAALESEAQAAIPEALLSSTMTAVKAYAAGGAAAAAVSANVAGLTKGVLNMMFWNSVKTVMAMAAAIAVGGAGVTAAVAVAKEEAKAKPPPNPAVTETVSAVPDTKAARTPPPEAGRSVNGMQLVLQTAPEAWYVVGDSIKLRVVWKNQSDHDLTLCTREFYKNRRCFFGNVTLTGTNGAVSSTGWNIEHMGPPDEKWLVVKARQELALELVLSGFDSSSFLTLEKPGKYNLWLDYTMDAETADRLFARNERSGRLWMGKVVSNPLEITVLSQEEYTRQAAHPLVGGAYDGLSISLQSAKTNYGIGEMLVAKLVLANAGKRALTIPWTSVQVVHLRKEDVPSPLLVHHPDDVRPPLVVEPGAVKEVDNILGSENRGDKISTPSVRYRAQVWIPAPDGSEKPAEPVRTISAPLVLSVSATRQDAERLIREAARDLEDPAIKKGNSASAALTTLRATLDTVAAWLPEFANDTDAGVASLAQDLMLARKIRTLYLSGGVKEQGFIALNDAGSCRYVPENIGSLAGIGQPVADPGAFARDFMRLCRGHWYAGQRPSFIIRADSATRMSRVCDQIRLIMKQAEAEGQGVYDDDFKICLSDAGKLLPCLGISQNFYPSLLVGVEATDESAGRGIYQAMALADFRGDPGAFKSWKQKELPAAIARLRSAANRLGSKEALSNFLSALPKRQEHIGLVLSGDPQWGAVAEALKTVRAWREQVMVNLILDPPPNP
jgi:RNA polymerase sigma factor (sigma-70 family)